MVMLTFSNAYKTLSSPVLSWLSSLRGVNPLSNFQGMILFVLFGLFIYKRTFIVLIPLTSVRNWGSISDFWHIVNQGNKAYISAKQLLSFSDFVMLLRIHFHAPIFKKNTALNALFGVYFSPLFISTLSSMSLFHVSGLWKRTARKCQKSSFEKRDKLQTIPCPVVSNN